MKKIAIIGSGALGSAFANILIDAGQTNVVVYGIDQNELNDLNNGKNTKYFGDISFNKIKTSNLLKEALDNASYIILAIPSIAIDSLMNQIKENINCEAVLINGAKGFYPNTDKPLHFGLEEKIKSIPLIKSVVSIIGPSFAIEMIKRSLTTIVAVSKDIKSINEVQKLFYTNYFRLYAQEDIVGAEVGGIYKNILAIGSGMLKAKGFKINTIAAYLTRGLNEMAVFNEFMGGKKETIYGLTGLGDLILTATDMNSRNFTFGYNYVLNNTKDTNTTLEGLTALRVVEEIREKNNLYLPLEKAIYNIIFKSSTIENEINAIWSNDLKNEN